MLAISTFLRISVIEAEGMTPIGITLSATYNVSLVVLSVGIAVFGSYVALVLTSQVSQAQGQAQKLWLMGGTITLGISIWAMHFIGMLAYQLPTSITYDLSIVFVSMAVAIGGSGAGLFVASRQQVLSRLSSIIGGLFIGLGIIGLHFVAMSATRVAAIPLYDPKLIVLSSVIAVGLSSVALRLAFHSSIENRISESKRKLGGIILMGAAIVGMHYTAMAALCFQPSNLGNQLADMPVQIFGSTNSRLAVAVGSATLLILLLALFVSLLSQHFMVKAARAEAVQRSEERFRSLVHNASDVIAIVAEDCTINYLSPSITRILGYTPEDWLGKKAFELIHPEDLPKAEGIWREARCCPGTNLTMESQLQHANGQTRDFEISVNNLLAEPSVIGIVVTCRDVTERKQAEEALNRALKEQESIMESILDIVYVLDLKGNLVRWNKRLNTITGLSPKELSGRPALAFFPEVDQPMIARAIQETFKKGKAEVEGRLITSNGILAPYEWNGVTLEDEAGNVIGMAGIGRDTTERKQAEAQLQHNAFHDALTGLPNRALFMERLIHTFEHSKRHEDYLCAVLFLDLDRFKVINDSLGHTFGDQLLVAIARRLDSCLRPRDTVARLGGDEFTILLEDIEDVSDAMRVAERVQAELALPFELSGRKMFTTASIGIALSAASYDHSEDLLRDADIAMYQAKSLGKARYALFNADMHAQAVALLQLETELRRAIERQEFQIYYQPIVSLSSGRISGFEALVRWQHPQRGLLEPEEFIVVAEETGLIIPIDQWVLREACHQMQQWQERFPPNSAELPPVKPLTISVNLYNPQFRQPDLLKHIKAVLQEADLDAHSLELEITENSIMQNDESATARLSQLRELGIQLAIDDFGTGYSSLSRLHYFPIDVLKIDRSFVSKIGTDEGNFEITETIVTLAQKLGVDVTAEGVETAEQLAQLRTLDCKYGQGYFFSRPLESKAAEALLVAKPRW